jgi:hypothetical protein
VEIGKAEIEVPSQVNKDSEMVHSHHQTFASLAYAF